MNRFRLTVPPPSFPGIILWVAGGHLFLGLIALLLWFATNDFSRTHWYFGYESPIFFIVFAILECMLTWMVWQRFAVHEPLRIVWLCIWMSACCHLVGSLFSQLFTADTPINPLFESSLWSKELVTAYRQIGQMTGGTLQMLVLACGLLLAIRVYGRTGILARLKFVDIIMLTIVAAFSLSQLAELFLWVTMSRPPRSVFKIISWGNDPLLCALFFEAVIIRRSVTSLGGGLIAKVWGALAVAIFLTSLGNLGNWAANYGSIPWPVSSLTWYIWYVASAAYVLAPAYQIEAAQTARERLTFLPAFSWQYATPSKKR